MDHTQELQGYPRRMKGVVVTTDGARMRLQSAEGSTVCEVNETALALWQLCDGSTTPEEMIDGVCTLFPDVHGSVVDDVDRALRELTQAGLLDWTPAPTPEESRT